MPTNNEQMLIEALGRLLDASFYAEQDEAGEERPLAKARMAGWAVLGKVKLEPTPDIETITRKAFTSGLNEARRQMGRSGKINLEPMP